jgi:hypothetical protein
MEWAQQNAVEFDVAKTEAILSTKKKDKRHPKMKSKLGNGKEIPYNNGATRWLGFWMDSALNFNEHFTKRMAKARHREAESKRLHGNYGINPRNMRTIMTATIQTTALFGSEIWWREKGQQKRSEEVQKMLKRQARAITGSMKTTPIGALMAEASVTPAVVLLNHRPRRFADRIASLPKDHMAKQMLQLGSTKTTKTHRT